MKSYTTVRHDARVELIINKSRFIGWCYPAKSEEEALATLQDIRKQHRDASHNCYAYSIGVNGSIARYSDDGEPGGTAGLPMMEAVRNKGVTDVITIVTRYFGGTLLGAGGLVRAYSKVASAAIEAAERVWMRPCIRYALSVDYARWGMVEPLLYKAGEVKDILYADMVRVSIIIPEEEGAKFVDLIVERTDGRAMIEALEAVFGEFKAQQCSDE